MDGPLVSILIPTLNSEKTLKKCLSSIINQTYKNIEIILIDGGSNDSTTSIASDYSCKILTLIGKERSAQLNYGSNAATGKYIYRVDSDFVLDMNLVSEAVNKCECENLDAISVYVSPDPTISFWSKVRKLEKDCYKNDLKYNGARFIKTELYRNMNGFNESLVAGEDYDFINKVIKLNYKVSFISSEEVHLGEPKSLVDIIKKQFYYGTTIGKFINENKINGIIQISPLRIVWLKNWKKFIMHPILTTGFIIYEITIYASAASGYIYATIKRSV